MFTSLWNAYGPFHVIFLHLPIGLVAGIAMIEAWSLISERGQAARVALPALYLFAAGAALLTVLAGLSLAGQGQPESPQTLFWHRNFGLVTLLFIISGTVLCWRQAPRWAQLGNLAALLLVIGVTGHLGGSLTHGDDFLTRRLPEPLRSWVQPAPAPAPPLKPNK